MTPAAASALLPKLVPRIELPQAIALNSLAFQSAAIAGPAIGGGLLFAGGLSLVYGTCVSLLALAGLLIVTAPTPKHEPVPGRRTFTMMKEGLVYVRDNKIVFGAISLDLVVVLFGGATALLPVFARRGAAEIGLRDAPFDVDVGASAPAGVARIELFSAPRGNLGFALDQASSLGNASSSPCRPPQATKVHEAPCQRPPSSIVAMMLTISRRRPSRLPPRGMYR